MNDADKIEVEEIGPGRALVKVNGESLPFRLDDAHARVEAETIGAWVRMPRPRDARPAVRRLMKLGIINDSEVCETVSQTSDAGGRPAVELWLTRSGALKFASRSNGKRAPLVLDLLVRVFFAVVDRMVAGGESGTEDIEAQVERIVSARLAHLHLPAPVTGQAARAYIAAPLRMLARRMATLDASLTERQHLGSLHTELRDTMGLRRDTRFEEIPSVRLGDAVSWIAARERAIGRREKRAAKAKAPAKPQGSLRLVQSR